MEPLDFLPRGLPASDSDSVAVESFAAGPASGVVVGFGDRTGEEDGLLTLIEDDSGFAFESPYALVAFRRPRFPSLVFFLQDVSSSLSTSVSPPFAEDLVSSSVVFLTCRLGGVA